MTARKAMAKAGQKYCVPHQKLIAFDSRIGAYCRLTWWNCIHSEQRCGCQEASVMNIVAMTHSRVLLAGLILAVPLTFAAASQGQSSSGQSSTTSSASPTPQQPATGGVASSGQSTT